MVLFHQDPAKDIMITPIEAAIWTMFLALFIVELGVALLVRDEPEDKNNQNHVNRAIPR